jgi:4-hydroxy-tetrahydrodipicolinate synthase
MFLAYRQGDTASAQRWAVPVAKLTAALFRETSPAPLKYALSLLGFMSPKLRLPLVELTDAAKAEVAGVMEQMCADYPEFVIGKLNGSRHDDVRVAAA